MADIINIRDAGHIKDYGILAFCFRYKMLEGELITTDGQKVEIIDAGLRNRNAGPDFFNAKIRFDDKLWVGSVVILGNTGDWNKHSLSENKYYANTILVVCLSADEKIIDINGNPMPVLIASVPFHVRQNYQRLLTDGGCDLCRSNVAENVSTLTKRSWMAVLETEWMEERVGQLKTMATKNEWADILAVETATNNIATKAQRQDFMKNIFDARNITDMRKVVTNYLSSFNLPHGRMAVEKLIVNTICPFLFAYGCQKSKDAITDKAFDVITETLPLETKNTKVWKENGIEIKTGGNSKAVERLQREYCDKKKCLHCRFGFEFLKKKGSSNQQTSTRREPMQLAFWFC